ncbi:nucleotidyltransferase domain-containing protein [Sorangium sp. So ce426]|uniref:nucleotidyltransferase domain-containing protein n=1 Tax=Sorangium sp. So ce426 TaxID=3133312 RepID=UPI003F5B79D1
MSGEYVPLVRPTWDAVVRELDDLRAFGLDAVLFGGWAKELLAGWRYGPHEDIDLLVVCSEIDRIDAFVRASGRAPFAAKRHAHKRAYRSEGVLVEALHVVPAADGWTTRFFARHVHRWQTPLARDVALGERRIAVVTADNVRAYEREHHLVEAAFYAEHPQFEAEIRARYGDTRMPYDKFFDGPGGGEA